MAEEAAVAPVAVEGGAAAAAPAAPAVAVDVDPITALQVRAASHLGVSSSSRCACAPVAYVQLGDTAAGRPTPSLYRLCLQRVLRRSLVVDGLRRGLHEVAKSLAKANKQADGSIVEGGARLCILAADCNEVAYTNLVKALCVEKGVPLFEVPSASDLGVWVGLCKVDKEGNPRKIVKTSVASITDFGEHSRELEIVLASVSTA